MFDLHRDYLAAMMIDERRAEAEQRGKWRRALRQRRVRPSLVDRMLAALGGWMVRAGGYLQRRSQVTAPATLLVR